MFEVEFRNTATVVCPLVPVFNGLLVVRRGLPEGYGKLGLPGGFQDFEEDPYHAAAREVFEETGIVTYANDYKLVDFLMDDQKHNLVFLENKHSSTNYVWNGERAIYKKEFVIKYSREFKNSEVLELVYVTAESISCEHDYSEWAFSTHYDQVRKYFERN